MGPNSHNTGPDTGEVRKLPNIRFIETFTLLVRAGVFETLEEQVTM